MAEWYVTHMGMSIARKMEGGPNTHFLADNSGQVMIEIYNNPPDQVPDYANMNPLILHLAFVCENPEEKRAELEKVGATFAEEVRIKDGSHLVMMRDPRISGFVAFSAVAPSAPSRPTSSGSLPAGRPIRTSAAVVAAACCMPARLPVTAVPRSEAIRSGRPEKG